MKDSNDKFFAERFRWTILVTTAEADEFTEEDFLIIQKTPNLFNEEYTIMEIESLISEPEYGTDEVLDMTNALAVHEEFTNAVLVRKDDLEDISSDIYPWEKAGGVFLGDMLTSLERLQFLIKYIYDEKKELVTIDDITIRMTKDGPKLPLADHVDDLFKSDVYSAQWKDWEITLWWQSIIEERGMFLVILDEDLLEDDDNDDDILPRRTPYSSQYDWGDYYDDVYGYDYDDRYYRRT